jgi:thiol-disulfide isomerase/thioredoxin
MKNILPVVLSSFLGLASLAAQSYGCEDYSGYNQPPRGYYQRQASRPSGYYQPDANNYSQPSRQAPRYPQAPRYNNNQEANYQANQSNSGYYQPDSKRQNEQSQYQSYGYYDPKTGDLEQPQTAPAQSRPEQKQQPVQQPQYRPPVQQAVATRINWLANYTEAANQAKAENKPIVVLFTGTSWCPACMKLEAEVLKRPEFARGVGNNFVFLKAEFNDYSEEGMRNSPYRSLMERYNVNAYPTFVVIDAAGQLLYKVNYQSGGPAAYVQALNRGR